MQGLSSCINMYRSGHSSYVDGKYGVSVSAGHKWLSIKFLCQFTHLTIEVVSNLVPACPESSGSVAHVHFIYDFKVSKALERARDT